MEVWQPVATFPSDRRSALFTRSVNDDGEPVAPWQDGRLVQVLGWYWFDGSLIIAQVLQGDPGENFVPTHWHPDPREAWASVGGQA
jgi:hypothetical protein